MHHSFHHALSLTHCYVYCISNCFHFNREPIDNIQSKFNHKVPVDLLFYKTHERTVTKTVWMNTLNFPWAHRTYKQSDFIMVTDLNSRDHRRTVIDVFNTFDSVNEKRRSEQRICVLCWEHIKCNNLREQCEHVVEVTRLATSRPLCVHFSAYNIHVLIFCSIVGVG